ncbi:transmembrane protein 182 [Sardina pilchardus]|uniref:transmembrane protein 182 n=1 Tax=Sardina pilchardus TaxID=27697 RepID=UPI002E15E10D
MATSSESAEVYRGLFMAVVLLGISLVMVAGLLSIGAHSAARAALYRAAGALYLTGGLLLLSVLVLHVVWFHGMSTLEHYVLQQGAALCPGFHLSVRYGPSFLIAPVGLFFCLLSGTLHLALAATAEKPLSLPTGNCEKALSLPAGNCEKALSLPTGNCEDRDELI